MPWLSRTFDRLRRRQRLRYWALALPLLIFAATLPFLRPLRFPSASQISDDEAVRLIAIRTIAEDGQLALSPEAVRDRDSALVWRERDNQSVLLPAQNPMLAVLGAGAYHGVRVARDTLGSVRGNRPTDDVFGVYILTLLLATLPTAVTTVLLYRCGRVLELSRTKRFVLALGCVACTCLLPYGTVINPQAPAAMLAAVTLTCVLQAVVKSPPPLGGGWLVLAGLSAGLGAAIHPALAVFAIALMLAMLAMPWRRRMRILAILLLAFGALLPMAVHRVLLVSYGSPWWVDQLLVPQTTVLEPPLDAPPTVFPPAIPGDDEVREAFVPHPRRAATLRVLTQLAYTLFGSQGLLVFFPAVVLPLAGIAAVLLRYWPKATRALALATFVGALAPFVARVLAPWSRAEHMFGPQSMIPMLPVLMFWSGVLLRGGWAGRSSTLSMPITAWSLAGLSAAVSAIGLLHPYPKGGFTTYAPLPILREAMMESRSEIREPSTAPIATPATVPTTLPAVDPP